MFVYVCVSICVCVHVHVSVCVCTCVCVSVCVCVHACVHVCVLVFVCVHVCVSVCVCVHVCVCVERGDMIRPQTCRDLEPSCRTAQKLQEYLELLLADRGVKQNDNLYTVMASYSSPFTKTGHKTPFILSIVITIYDM